eukprot:gene7209-5255_t
MADTPVRDFCYGTPYQMEALSSKRVDTLKDLLCATRRDVDVNMRHESNPPPNVNASLLVYKRHVIGYAARHLNKVFIDFDALALTRDRALTVGGAWPNQWYGLRHVRHSYAAARYEPVEQQQSAPAPAPIVVSDYNRDQSEEDAFNEALRQSLASVPASPVLKSDTTPAPSLTYPLKMTTEATDNTPIELCCPITLCLFEDPVMTIHHTTNERAAISDWLSNKKTDPIFGTPLLVTTLFPNIDVKLQCDNYRSRMQTASAPPLPPGAAGAGSMLPAAAVAAAAAGAAPDIAVPIASARA